eukprot:42657-Rhodomonas_salina.1
MHTFPRQDRIGRTRHHASRASSTADSQADSSLIPGEETAAQSEETCHDLARVGVDDGPSAQLVELLGSMVGKDMA